MNEVVSLNSLGHTVEMLEDACSMFQADQVVILNERIGYLLKYGELIASYDKVKDPQLLHEAQRIGGPLQRSEESLHRLTLLYTAAKAISHLMSSANARGSMHFPQLRIRVPSATQLILSMVGEAGREIHQSDLMTLTAFGEYYRYIQLWNGVGT